jgi:microcystin-dependent protein
MSESFVGEIRLFGFNFPPMDWALCNGQLLSTSQNDVLFSLLGTTFGGDGVNTFALPDLQGRVAVHPDGSGIYQSQKSGSETVTLTVNQLPMHTHALNANSNASNQVGGQNNVLAKSVNPSRGSRSSYGPAQNLTGMNQGCIGNAGGSQPHNNMQPYQVVNFCISLSGIYPSRS